MPRIAKLVERTQKIRAGLAVATAVTAAILGTFSNWSWDQKILAIATAYILFPVVSYLFHSHYYYGVFIRSISLANLTGMKVITDPEEHLAYHANKAARHMFGKHTISYHEYKNWREKNSSILSCIVDDQRNLLAFFDVFPLTDEAGKRIMDGKCGEHQLKIKDILREEDDEKANYIYIASVMSCYKNDLLEMVTIQQLGAYIAGRFAPREGRYYVAVAYTRNGESLLKRNGFILRTDRKISIAGSDIYVLDSEGAARALRRILNERLNRRRRKNIKEEGIHLVYLG